MSVAGVLLGYLDTSVFVAAVIVLVPVVRYLLREVVWIVLVQQVLDLSLRAN